MLRVASTDAGAFHIDRPISFAICTGDNAYVGSVYSGTIYIVGSEAEGIRTFGGYGEGPGEFRLVGRAGCLNDTLWVTDPSTRRISFFQSDGRHIRTVRVGSTLSLASGEFLELDSYVAKDSLLIWINQQQGLRFHRTLVLTDETGMILDTLLDHTDALGATLRLRGEDLGLPDAVVLNIARPFADVALIRTAPEERAVVIVQRPTATSGNAATFTVTKFDFQSRQLYSVDVCYTPYRTPDAAVEQLLSRQYRSLRHVTPGYSLPARRQFEKRLRRVLHVPRFQPPVTAIVVGEDSTTWLRGHEADPQRVVWLVLDRAGVMIGQLATNAEFQVHHARRNDLWATEQEPDGPVELIKYSVRRSALAPRAQCAGDNRSSSHAETTVRP